VLGCHHRSAKGPSAEEQNLTLCKTKIPKAAEKPAPGKTKADGRWTCVYGGGVDGSVQVTLVQVASGRLTGILIGDNGTAGWEGAVVGDEARIHFKNEDSGTVLKIDPGGRAMSGQGWSFRSADGICQPWTLTCTRS
jgi:hypothetical protein